MLPVYSSTPLDSSPAPPASLSTPPVYFSTPSDRSFAPLASCLLCLGRSWVLVFISPRPLDSSPAPSARPPAPLESSPAPLASCVTPLVSLPPLASSLPRPSDSSPVPSASSEVPLDNCPAPSSSSAAASPMVRIWSFMSLKPTNTLSRNFSLMSVLNLVRAASTRARETTALFTGDTSEVCTWIVACLTSMGSSFAVERTSREKPSGIVTTAAYLPLSSPSWASSSVDCTQR